MTDAVRATLLWEIYLGSPTDSEEAELFGMFDERHVGNSYLDEALFLFMDGSVAYLPLYAGGARTWKGLNDFESDSGGVETPDDYWLAVSDAKADAFKLVMSEAGVVSWDFL